MKKAKRPIDICRLQQMVLAQENLQKRLGIHTNMPLNEREKQTKEMALAIMSELQEVLQEINWKAWKKTRKDVDQHKVRGEIIDLWHFCINLSIIWGMSEDDIFQHFMAKNKENHERQNKGY